MTNIVTLNPPSSHPPAAFIVCPCCADNPIRFEGWEVIAVESEHQAMLTKLVCRNCTGFLKVEQGVIGG